MYFERGHSLCTGQHAPLQAICQKEHTLYCVHHNEEAASCSVVDCDVYNIHTWMHHKHHHHHICEGVLGLVSCQAVVCMQVSNVAAAVPSSSVSQVLVALASYLADSPHLEFLLCWLRHVCVKHGKTLQNEKAAVVMPAIRSLQRVLSKSHEDLSAACDSNLYTLQYLCAAGCTNPSVNGK